MDLENVNYLRELVGLPPETETKLDVTKPRRRPKSGQIRKAVKRYTELSKRYKKIIGGISDENAATSLYC